MYALPPTAIYSSAPPRYESVWTDIIRIIANNNDDDEPQYKHHRHRRPETPRRHEHEHRRR